MGDALEAIAKAVLLFVSRVHLQDERTYSKIIGGEDNPAWGLVVLLLQDSVGGKILGRLDVA